MSYRESFAKKIRQIERKRLPNHRNTKSYRLIKFVLLFPIGVGIILLDYIRERFKPSNPTNPKKEMKTRAVAAKTGLTPLGKKGSQFAGSTLNAPEIAQMPKMTINVSTTMTCVPPDSLAPMTLRAVSRMPPATAPQMGVMGKNSDRYSPMPTR